MGMERLLRYSLEHERPIRLMWERAGKLVQRTVTVLALTEDRVRLTSKRPAETWEMGTGCILSADFTRRDEGEG